MGNGGVLAVEPTAVPVGSTTDFETFFEAERGRLFRALMLVTRNTDEAEEILQEAFLKVWERWSRLREQEPVGYLFRVAMNAHRSRLRRAMRSVRNLAQGSPPADPFDAVAERDEALRIMASLTPRQRSAVVLTELVGLSFDDAARALGIRPGTVRVLVSQARASLSKTMEDHDA
jgi:RNA polymerase sigma factor (sigma-70 family)